EVTEEPQTVVVDALPSRRVRVLLTRDDHELLVIQAASTGWVTGSDAQGIDGHYEQTIYVPPDESITIAVIGRDGEVRMGRLAPETGSLDRVTDLDLRVPTTLVRAGVPAPVESSGAEPEPR
ncbi:MAG: hypothetical protein JNK02_16465, partial [Planctomycetes bacterium]|nr:hypothetical protein [Planctomycetota bacterium]